MTDGFLKFVDADGGPVGVEFGESHSLSMDLDGNWTVDGRPATREEKANLEFAFGGSVLDLARSAARSAVTPSPDEPE